MWFIILTICSFCGKDSESRGYHSWRCKSGMETGNEANRINNMLNSICSTAPNKSSEKKLFYSGYSAGKIIPVLCVAGKMKYICWETCLENFLLNGRYRREAAKIFLGLWTISENFLKLWMFVIKRT